MLISSLGALLGSGTRFRLSVTVCGLGLGVQCSTWWEEVMGCEVPGFGGWGADIEVIHRVGIVGF